MAFGGNLGNRAKTAAPFVAFVLAVGLALALGTMNSALLNQLAELRTAPRDNVQWGLMQAQNESARLQLAVMESLASGTIDHADLTKRFDILYSRFEMIETAPVFEMLRASPSFVEKVTRGREGIDRIAAVMILPAPELRERLPELKQMVDNFRSDMQVMVLEAIQKFAASSDDERADLSSLIKTIAAAAALLLFVLAVTVILLFVQGVKLRRREAALLESRNLMAAVSSVSLDSIAVCDREGRVISCNEPAERHLVTETAGDGRPQLMIPGYFRKGHRREMDRYLASGQTNLIGRRIEVDYRHPDGREFPAEIATGVTETKNGPLFIYYMRDISQRKADEAAMSQALADANKGLRTKESFLATISHEIRTPLNGVIGVMDLLRDTKLTIAQARYVQVAQQSGEALLKLISDILDVSKMNVSGVELNPEPVQLHEIVKDAVETTSAGAAGNSNRVSVSIGGNVPKTVMADGGRLGQVMLNLLSNAQKFTKGGRIKVSLEAADGDAGLPLLEFSVTDTGKGFDPALAESLFRDFTTLDASYQRETGGTGLGLAISRRIVEAMGGEIGAESRPGTGSRFWFRVRLPVTAAAVRPVEAPPISKRTGLAVLVAEDNATNLMVTRQMLEAAGHHVDDARNGAEAVVRARAKRYDLILMDISMPGMDGIEATHMIRCSAGLSRSTPIIALTANAMQEGADQAIAAGMDGYLAKPIGRAELLAAIERIVEESMQANKQPLFDEGHYAQLCADITEQSAREVLNTFLGELADRHADAGQAHARGDVQAYGKICHAISGAASMVGAASLAVLAQRADAMARAGRGDEALATFPELDGIVAMTRDLLAHKAAA